MRLFRGIYRSVFLYTIIIQIMINLAIQRNLNLTYPFLIITIGTLIISLFVTLSIVIFKTDKGIPLINIVISILFFIPSILVLRRIYDIIVFRYSFVIYLFFGSIMATYGLTVLYLKKKSIIELNELNKLIQIQNSEKK